MEMNLSCKSLMSVRQVALPPVRKNGNLRFHISLCPNRRETQNKIKFYDIDFKPFLYGRQKSNPIRIKRKSVLKWGLIEAPDLRSNYNREEKQHSVFSSTLKDSDFKRVTDKKR